MRLLADRDRDRAQAREVAEGSENAGYPDQRGQVRHLEIEDLQVVRALQRTCVDGLVEKRVCRGDSVKA